MCGRYASFLPAEALARIFGTVNPLPNLETTWNMAPTRDAPVVRLSREGERHLDALKWGLVPYFTKDLKKARKPINARSVPVQRVAVAAYYQSCTTISVSGNPATSHASRPPRYQ
jgi:putative SOS response-associated peptidase YedK